MPPEFKNILDGIVGNAIWGILSAFLIFIFFKRKKIINFFSFGFKAKSIIGVDWIDETMGKGITPEKALTLCQNNFKFLGIAANKLVKSNEFNGTVKRCNRAGEPIKLLLSHPSNPILQFAARRSGKTLDEYRVMVDNTLSRLKQLKKEHGYNIEARLYKSTSEMGAPSFRLFFIDNEAVLVSYYVYGEGEGLTMPQIRIRKSKSRDTANFYYPFDHYFNSLWEESELIDLSDKE